MLFEIVSMTSPNLKKKLKVVTSLKKEEKSSADLEVNTFLCHFHIFPSVFLSAQFIGLIFVKCKVCLDFWGLLNFSWFRMLCISRRICEQGRLKKKKCFCASGLDFTPV